MKEILMLCTYRYSGGIGFERFMSGEQKSTDEGVQYILLIENED